MSLFKRIFGNLFSEDKSLRILKNKIFEIPYNKDKIQIISMPKIGNESFNISKWFYKVGETIKEGKTICELENKNTTLEFESNISGKLVSITKKTGFLNFGDEICKIEKV
jgi:biotin carboxyl carrier protein